MKAPFLQMCQLLTFILYVVFSSRVFALPVLTLNHQSSLFIEDNYLWRKVPQDVTELENPSEVWKRSHPAKSTIVGLSGLYLAQLTIKNEDQKTWYLVPNANFVDLGQAYWQPTRGTVIKLKNFSQLTTSQTPQLLHFQALPLSLKQSETGTLWVYMSAKHYATAASITLYDEAHFYHYQSVSNSLSLAAISIMLLLSLLTFLIFIRTQERIAISCAGYVGLHGIGWAAASGLIEDFSMHSTLNFSYLGMYIFPFAIACASQFVADLFQCKTRFIHLYKALTLLTFFGLGLGTVMLFMPFKLVFYLSHALAIVWICFTLYIGCYMLKEKDFRAKYFLVGNLLYSGALLYYMASHSQRFGPLEYPELMVVIALALDCICIVLSLSEWFKLKQNEYNRHFYMSRIDPLTQLGNRYALEETLSTLPKQYLVIYIDFDGLKLLNDKLGHNEGDKLIKYGAKALAKSLATNGHVFRVGGDEFIAIITRSAAHSAPELFDHYTALMNSVNAQIKTIWPQTGISFGIEGNKKGQSPSECLSLADKKMYQQKKQKSASVFHNAD